MKLTGLSRGVPPAPAERYLVSISAYGARDLFIAQACGPLQCALSLLSVLGQAQLQVGGQTTKTWTACFGAHSLKGTMGASATLRPSFIRWLGPTR